MRFSRAILHFDGDSFFASVEQIMNYKLRGWAVITGGERGAITSVSKEGKRMGLNRGISLNQARVLCPNLVVVPSDYTSYSIFARRMYAIVREFAFDVEEYSIDECFADITGLDQRYKMSYEEIACMIKEKLEANLGITFGVGLGPNKVIAKAASKHRKPAGFTSVSKSEINEFLKDMPVGKLWGIGIATSHDLNRLGITTALDLAKKEAGWFADNKISKPYREMWQELRGEYVKRVNIVPDSKIGSIIKSRTFRPPSSEKEYVFSELSKNIEIACIQIRRHRMKAKHARFYLKSQDFRYRSFDMNLSIPLSDPKELIKLARENFNEIYRPNTLYRTTGIALSAIVPEGKVARDLFGEIERIEENSSILSVVDNMSRKYGMHSIFLGSSMRALVSPKKKFSSERLALIGDRWKKTIDIPFLGKAR